MDKKHKLLILLQYNIINNRRTKIGIGRFPGRVELLKTIGNIAELRRKYDRASLIVHDRKGNLFYNIHIDEITDFEETAIKLKEKAVKENQKKYNNIKHGSLVLYKNNIYKVRLRYENMEFKCIDNLTVDLDPIKGDGDFEQAYPNEVAVVSDNKVLNTLFGDL